MARPASTSDSRNERAQRPALLPKRIEPPNSSSFHHLEAQIATPKSGPLILGRAWVRGEGTSDGLVVRAGEDLVVTQFVKIHVHDAAGASDETAEIDTTILRGRQLGITTALAHP